MKKAFILFIIISVSATIFFGCSKKNEDEKAETIVQEIPENNSDTSATTSTAIVSTEQETEPEQKTKQKKKKETEVKLLSIATEITDNSAHKKYLSENVEFKSLPQNNYSGSTLVVGNNRCVLYEKIPLKTDDDLSGLKKIMNLPKGAILHITGDVIQKEKDTGYDWGQLFHFEDERNWFYPVEYEGKKGIVFGADVAGQRNSNEQNAILTLLYKNDKDSILHYDDFYPICGYTEFTRAIENSLRDYRLAIQNVASDEYRLYLDEPDDMIALYLSHSYNPYNREAEYGKLMGRNLIPLFLTTDLFAHCEHLMFDRILQDAEENTLLPKLLELTNKVESKIESDLENNPKNETVKIAQMYFQVGKALLELAPTLKEKEYYYEDDVWIDADKNKILSKYNASVKSDVESILSLKENSSKVFTFSDGSIYDEDFSSYKPRGHYTKNGLLEAYFRAMNWFGRINFPLPDSNRGKNDKREKLARNMTKVAIYINDIFLQDYELYQSWEEVFEPISVLVGKADDLSFADLVPLWEKQKVTDTLKWISDENNILSFATLARENLTPPLITDKSVFYSNQGEGDRSNPETLKAAMGWRFLGQRFTYDAWLFNEVSAPRIDSRTHVSGLDVMASFGSKTADSLLQDEYKTFGKLSPTINKFKDMFNSKNEKFWNETYYNSVLALSKSQATFEQGSGFYFTESPLWNIKALESSLGTWAELKHDTILYSKTSAAEKGGDGIDISYRTDPIPQTVHYIEPNIEFFVALSNSLRTLQKYFNDYNLLSVNADTCITSFVETAERVKKIVNKEYMDEPVSKEDLAWIPSIPSLLAKIVLPIVRPFSSYISDTEQLKMAIIADVFTNEEEKLALEVAVGKPKRIYVALNDGQGGKRIAVGYKFDYYEFETSSADRMTDDDWKKIVYENPDDLDEYKPSWYPETDLNATGFCGHKK